MCRKVFDKNVLCGRYCPTAVGIRERFFGGAGDANPLRILNFFNICTIMKNFASVNLLP